MISYDEITVRLTSSRAKFSDGEIFFSFSVAELFSTGEIVRRYIVRHCRHFHAGRIAPIRVSLFRKLSDNAWCHLKQKLCYLPAPLALLLTAAAQVYLPV